MEIAATSLCNDVFLIPKNVTSARPTALHVNVDSFGGKLGEHVGWRNGNRNIAWIGTPRIVATEELNEHWGILMEMERFKCRTGQNHFGAVALNQDLTKAFKRVSLLWAWATHFCFSKKILRVLCGYFEHQRRVQFEGCVAEPLQTRVQVELLAVTKIHLLLKLRVFVDDCGTLDWEAEMANKVMGKLQTKVERDNGSNCQ